MFSQGDALGVAVSGGRDSMCLLDVLAEIERSWGLRLTVLHLNHGLRPEANEEEEFVRNEAGRRGLAFLGERVSLGQSNIEEGARKARLGFFERAMRERGLRCVATGHTRSDQAETVLYRLLRGTGMAGLRGIQPVTSNGLVRPLLEISRDQVNTWVADRGLAWREDDSNTDSRFARNRIRHELLPMLVENWNGRIAESLARTAEIASADEAFLQQATDQAWRDHSTVEPDGSVVLELGAPLPLALKRRLVRRAIECVRGDLRQIEYEHVAAIVAMAEAGNGHGRVMAPGVDAMRSFNWLRISVPRNPADENRNWSFPLEIPGNRIAPGGNRIQTGFGELACGYNGSVVGLEGAAGKSLILRNWRPGDTFRGQGTGEQLKIKELFQRQRIPLWERRNWPVIVLDQRVIWAGEFGTAAEYAVRPGESGIFVKFERSGAAYRPLVNQNGDF